MSFTSQQHSPLLSPQSGPMVLRAAATWQLAKGGVLRVRLRETGVLRVSSGQAWVTLDRVRGDTPADAGDLFVSPGHDLSLRAGQSLVLEAWPAGQQGSMGLSWQPETQPAGVFALLLAWMGRWVSVFPRRLRLVQRQPRF